MFPTECVLAFIRGEGELNLITKKLSWITFLHYLTLYYKGEPNEI